MLELDEGHIVLFYPQQMKWQWIDYGELNINIFKQFIRIKIDKYLMAGG